MNGRRLGLLVATVVALTGFSGVPSFAVSPDYSEGMKLFAAKNYRAAAAKFESAMRSGADANLVYYAALSQQLANNRARARQLYEYAASAYPGSRVAQMASDALKALGGPGSTSGSSSNGSSTTVSSSSGRSALAGVPTEVRIPYTERHGGVYVEGSLSGRPVKFHLDTGAQSILIGANQLQDMGIQHTSGRERFKSGGVGDNIQTAWDDKFDLRLGQIYIRDCPVVVQEHYDGEPLLGQTVLSNFDITVDKDSGQVILRLKGSGHTNAVLPRGTIDVPFRVAPGGHLIVSTLVNNRPMDMYFDTGADGVAMTFEQLKQLKIDPPDGPAQQHQGVAGTTNGWNLSVDSLKVGTIVRENFQVSVLEKSTMKYPLLGQTFYAGYKYQVDQEKKVIHFIPQQ